MDNHPICVVDAATLVDHIQEIKNFVYQGQICLVVPQHASTPLERKFAQLTEGATKKPSRPSEPQRPRSSGRPAKVEKPAQVEQPTMDINPLVAGEFLARFRSDENQKGVEFQKDSEQYSPWRLLELEEESRSANENKPSSFAQAARKASVEKFSSSMGAANGPAKPRLVSRSAGVDGSPWKTSNKAMSLPISEIPKETRPVLGCVLWRLHEKGATLWDKNRTLLLCDDEKTNALAKKLGIVTKTMVDLRKLGDAEGMTDERRETFGDLEKHFNLPEMVKATPSLEIEKEAKMTSALPTPDEGNEAKVDVSGALKQVKCTAPSSSSRDSTESTHSAVSSKFERKSAELEEPHDQKASRSTTKGDRHKKSDVGGLSNAPSDEHEKRTGSRSSLRSAAVAAPIAEPAESDQAAVQPSQPISNTLDAEKKHSIAAWVKGLIDAANNSEHSGRDSPISGHSSAVEATAQQTEPAKPFKPLTYRQAVTGKADEVVKKNAPLSPKEIIHSPRASPAREPSPPKAEESIGSDEEEIVFNPKSKRLSAQKAQQVQQNKQAPQVAQSQQPQQPQTPQPSPRHGHARNVSGGRALIRGGFQRQSRPGPPPVVIDPDSFGRGLATNPQPVVARTFSPYGAHGRVANDRRGNHRSPNHRSSAQNIPPKVNGAALPNGSANAITLPPAEQIPATNGSAAAEPAPAVEAPVTTIVPSVLQPSPVVNGSPVGPSLPRSSPALNGLQNTPAFPIRVERPRYSPRGSPRRAPIVPEPEVGYVLKSGQTREATRGRGKLWVP